MEDGEERVLPVVLGEFVLFGLALGYFLVEYALVCIFSLLRTLLSHGLSCGLELSESLVGLHEIRVEYLAVEVGCPELEGSGSLEELSNTLRLFHARELHEDAAGVAEFLDVRLGYAEAVDTVAEHLEGVGHCALGLCLEHLDDICVGGLGADLVPHLICTENLVEFPCTVGLGIPGLLEEGDEIAPRVGDAVGFRSRESGGEVRILAIVCESLHEVLELHLEHHVHTALEVEAEVDFLCLGRLVGEYALLCREGVDKRPVAALCDFSDVVGLLGL